LPAEFCARGSLYDLLKAARCTPALQKALDWPRRIMMAMDAAKVQYSLRCMQLRLYRLRIARFSNSAVGHLLLWLAGI
jgi:hypothetical protein